MSSLSVKAGAINPNSYHIESLDYGAQWRKYYANNVLQSDVNFGNFHRGLNYEHFHGRVLDRFHQRKNSGELLPYTKYECIKHSATITGPSQHIAGHTDKTYGYPIRYEWRWLDSSIPCFTWFPGFVSGKLTWVDDTFTAAGFDNYWSYPQAAAAKLYSRGWDGLTFLAEFHQIIRMFRQAVPQFLRLGTSYLDLWRAAKFSSAFPSFQQWLSVRYGWRILLYDIQDINKLMSEVNTKSRSRNKERVGDNLTYQVDNSFVTGGDYKKFFSDITDVSLSVRGSIIADFIPAKVNFNVVKTAWELVPWSFVVDWFINVGRSIDALSFLLINDQYTCALGRYLTSERHVYVNDVQFAGWWSVGGYSNIEEFECTETVDFRQRRPCVVSVSPLPSVNLDGYKVIDLIALLGQLVGSLLSRR